jgi:hypothetical protein
LYRNVEDFMSFRRWLQFGLSLLAAGILAVSFTGCSNSKSFFLTQGNWAFSATSSSGPPFVIGGNVTQSGQVVSGTVHISGSTCFDVSEAISISGTLNGSSLVLQVPSSSGQEITVTGTATTNSVSGNYSVAGGCANGDSGTVMGNAVPSISGTWTGPINESGGAGETLSIALTQAATASADGSFALTGTVTYANSTCSKSGTITAGSLAGTFITELDVQTLESDDSQGSFTYSNVNLNSSTAPTSMTGDYDYSGLCTDTEPVTLTKQ